MKRSKFLAAHHDAAVAGKQHNLVVRAADFSAHGSRESIPHGPQAAAGQEMPGPVHVIELGRPHLVLAYVSYNDRVIIRIFHNSLI